ncbi:MAG TPA: hypothetical protein VGZ22_11910, partial [Isosphaeraceae bacterium]|nr:hypothetical protein [Isosphaeraceae bacterium]
KLSDYAETVCDQVLKGLSDQQFHRRGDITVNGKPGVQFEVTGILNETKQAYLVTVIESRDKVFAVTAGCPDPRYESNRALLANVVDTFAELPP